MGNRGHFGTVRTISTVPLDSTYQRHHSQPATALARAETAGGWRGAFVFRRGFLIIFLARGGRIEVAICDRAGELDRTARSPTSMTPQSTSIRGGGGWNGRDMASRLRFYEGIFVDFFGRVGFKAQRF